VSDDLVQRYRKRVLAERDTLARALETPGQAQQEVYVAAVALTMADYAPTTG
jgi:hypothetical protein